MILAWGAVLSVSCIGTAWSAEPGDLPLTTPPVAATIFNPNPAHLWNRLHRAIYMRIETDGTEYGEGRLDPLLWRGTKRLRVGPSHQEFIQMLDELIAGGRDALDRSPLKRALLQRDLWAVFDWVSRYDARQKPLLVRLARAIELLALSEDELRALPDNYAAAVNSKAFVLPTI